MAGWKGSERKKLAKGLGAGRTIEEMAVELGRKVEVVAGEAARLDAKKKILSAPITSPVLVGGAAAKPLTPEAAILRDLQTSPTYRELKNQFTSSELRFYEENYVALLIQFGENDISTSEKLQIHKAVEYLVFMGRNKEEQLEVLKRLGTLKQKVIAFDKSYPNGPTNQTELEVYKGYDDKITQLSRRRSDLSKEYGELESKNQNLFTELKATRTQRLSSTDRRTSITDLVAELMARDKRDKMGRSAELFKTFTDNHGEELSIPHKFEDGSVEPPVFTPELVEQTIEENKNAQSESEEGGE